jgi:hypothetical protein
VIGRLLAVGLLALAACGGGSASSSQASGQGVLAGVCPSTVVVQTDWNPEAEHGALYELAADGGDVDTEAKTYTAPLLAGGEDTGVAIEIRVGGPAIGSQPVSAQLYADESIMLGYVSTDEQVALAKDQPTVAVVAPNEISPFILMFDPARYHFDSFADIGRSGADVLYFQGATYMDYLVGAGDIERSQLDSSYDGTPARWVASDGAVVQQGFATAEPYIYEHELPEWDKPVDYLLVHDSGYEVYPQSLVARPDVVDQQSACLEKLVPIIQQAQVDYVRDPGRANALIVDLVDKYDTGWVYSAGVAAFSVHAQLDNGIVSNGPDDVLGNFELPRVQHLLDILEPIYAEQGKEIRAGLTPDDLVTNRFIDSGIGLD